MAIRTLSEKHTTDQMLERSMRNWEIARSQNQRPDVTEAELPAVKEFVTISRSVGLPGDHLAERLHEALGWPVFDREILRRMAGDDAARQRIFQGMDERAENWLQSFVRGFMHQKFVGREAYFNRLVETVAALSRSAPSIFMGRGVDMILPREIGVRIRLSASREFCARKVSERLGIAYDAAMREIEAVERDRAWFIKQNFHVMTDDATRFDLTINLERISVVEAAGLILNLMRSRGILG